VAESSAGVKSALSLLTVTVSVVFVPLGVLAGTWTTTVKVAEPPAAKLVIVPVIAPVPPAAGLVTVKAGPLVWLSDTNVALAGRLSVNRAFGAGAGPWFVTVNV